MKKIFLLFFISLFIKLLADNSEYCYVDEYYNSHPEEKKLVKIFKKVIDNKEVPIAVNSRKPLKIVMVYPGHQISDYWRRSKDSFVKRMNELKINYKLVDYFTKPKIEIYKQAKFLLSAIKDNTDYLIFTLDTKKHKRFVERIISLKKPKLILQNITTPLKQWKDRQPFMYVGFDHVIGTKKIADYYISKFKSGKYAILYGTQGYVSQMRGNTFIEYVSKKSRLELVEEYYTDFNKEKSKRATLDLIKNHKDLKFIYACSTDTALGAIEALKQKDLLGKIMINGWGGGSRELEAIKAKQMDVTVMRINDDNGIAMAEAIKFDLENKKIPLIFSGDFVLVTKNTSDKNIDDLVKKAFRYSKEHF